MCAFTYAWSLPVTWQRWQSHHLIHHSRKPMLHPNLMALCSIKPELLPLEVLHCGDGNFYHFPPVTLTLTRRILYTKLTCILWRLQDVQNELPTSKVFESYRLTKDGQADRQDRTYATRFLRDGKKYYICFVYNLLLFLTIKEFSKSVKIWWSYCKNSTASFFETQCTERCFAGDQ